MPNKLVSLWPWFEFENTYDTSPAEAPYGNFGAGHLAILLRHFRDDDEDTAPYAAPELPASRRFVRNPSRSPVRSLSNPPVRMGNLDN